MIILASASPRRADLLRALGLAFEVAPTRVDEATPPGSTAEQATLLVARRKAQAVPVASDTWVVAADTLGELDGELVGKPADAADAERILARLQGQTHRIVTAVVVRAPDGRLHEATESTRITFAPLSSERIRAYVATGEPLDKACAYAIQGGARAFVLRLQGDRSNVVGLPTGTLIDLLRRAAYPLPPHLRPS